MNAKGTLKVSLTTASGDNNDSQERQRLSKHQRKATHLLIAVTWGRRSPDGTCRNMCIKKCLGFWGKFNSHQISPNILAILGAGRQCREATEVLEMSACGLHLHYSPHCRWTVRRLLDAFDMSYYSFSNGEKKMEASSLHIYFVTGLDGNLKGRFNARENLYCSILPAAASSPSPSSSFITT